MIAITGVGWLNRDEFGCVMQQQQWPYADPRSLTKRLLDESVLRYKVAGFRRFDATSKAVVRACALALHDAGIVYSKKSKQDIGILGINEAGALRTNLQGLRRLWPDARASQSLHLYSAIDPAGRSSRSFRLSGASSPSRLLQRPYRLIAWLRR